MPISKRRVLSASLFGLFLGFVFLSLSAAAQTTAPNEWTWMGGSSTMSCTSETYNGIPFGPYCGQPGVYGTLGTPITGNIPGGRAGASNWTDSNGNLWLFGGFGYDAKGFPDNSYLNDLWEFNPSANEWMWVSGSSTISANGGGQPGVYGTLGIPAAGNIPGARQSASSWIDNNGNLWLFGGVGSDVGGSFCDLNDLWAFNPSTKIWIWMNGSNTVKHPGVYGILRMPSTGNTPGGRCPAASWTDSSGNFWLFGGEIDDANDNPSLYNDLWRFNSSTNEWAWMGGSSTSGSNYVNGTPSQPGVYGTLGTPDVGNIPGSRIGASSWTDRNGHLWLFGGSGADATGINSGPLNDLWEFSPLTNEWAWMGGNSTMNCGAYGCGQPGVYGTLGIPAPGNVPGGRFDATSWTDNSGNLWLFGGVGHDANGTYGNLNDLWEFNLSTKEWTWMGGSSTVGSKGGQSGVYGILGTPATGNAPGARTSLISWTDSSSNLWLFGGWGYDANGNLGELNDLWKYQTSTTPSFPITATPIFSPVAGTYTSMQAVTISDATPGAAIYYTTDGKTTPTTGSTLYTGAITIAATETIQAIAVATNYLNSAVATATYTINLPPPDFTVSASLASLTDVPGQIVVKSTVTPLNGFNSEVSFSCTSGLPAGATCSFFPATLTPSGLPASTTLTVTTSATTAAVERNSSPLLPGSALAVAFCCFGWKKRRRLPMLLLLAASAVGMGLLNGCAGASSIVTSPQPVTSSVTVTATSGSLSHTTTFSLTVN